MVVNCWYTVLLLCTLFPLTGHSQDMNGQTRLVEIKAVDSIAILRDSLEIDMLRISQNYEQVERILRRFPLQLRNLVLMPSVLPIDLPIEAFAISSPYGIRVHPVRKQIQLHAGIDVKAPLGKPVKATAAGVVTQVGMDLTLGVFVRIRHAFGFETTYGHLSGYCVKRGQSVGRSELIGKVGQTGLATGPHLHYTITKNGSLVDPFYFCFLLRRRLSLYQNTPAASFAIDSSRTVGLSSSGW